MPPSQRSLPVGREVLESCTSRLFASAMAFALTRAAGLECPRYARLPIALANPGCNAAIAENRRATTESVIPTCRDPVLCRDGGPTGNASATQ